MKAQTKMVVSLAVVCALAITAISGATYAWLSDSENSEIHVNVGKVDVSMDVSGFKLLSLGVDRTERGTFDNGGTAEVVKDEGGKAVVNISKATPGDAVQFTLTMYNSSTISIIWILKNIIDSAATPQNVYCNIIAGEVQFNQWSDVVQAPETKTKLTEVTIEIGIPKEASEISDGKMFVEFDAYQYNYDGDNTIPVRTPKELQDIANDLANPSTQGQYNNKKIMIMNDLDMYGIDWPKIDLNGNENFKKLTIAAVDGKGISWSGTVLNSCCGLITSANNMELIIEDLYVRSVAIRPSSEIGTGSGAFIGSLNNCTVTIKNCNVYSSTIIGINCGGIVGNSTGSALDIIGCHLDGINKDQSNLGGTSSVGGIIGNATGESGTTTIKDCTVDNYTIYGANGDYSAGSAMGVVGSGEVHVYNFVTNNNNVSSGHTANPDFIFGHRGSDNGKLYIDSIEFDFSTCPEGRQT